MAEILRWIPKYAKGDKVRAKILGGEVSGTVVDSSMGWVKIRYVIGHMDGTSDVAVKKVSSRDVRPES